MGNVQWENFGRERPWGGLTTHCVKKVGSGQTKHIKSSIDLLGRKFWFSEKIVPYCNESWNLGEAHITTWILNSHIKEGFGWASLQGLSCLRTHACACVCVCVCERERERERDFSGNGIQDLAHVRHMSHNIYATAQALSSSFMMEMSQ
jgi:hypothetical protein